VTYLTIPVGDGILVGVDIDLSNACFLVLQEAHILLAVAMLPRLGIKPEGDSPSMFALALISGSLRWPHCE
jgi:hypothetical protein